MHILIHLSQDGAWESPSDEFPGEAKLRVAGFE